MRADKVYQGDDDEVNLNLVPSPEGEGLRTIIRSITTEKTI